MAEKSGRDWAMADTKLVKSAGEHWVCSVLAQHRWAVALTRDGIERTDLLAVHSSSRRAIEVQVKAASASRRPNWPLNAKAQAPAVTDREWFVLVALPALIGDAPRSYVVPRDHLAAAAWIHHQDWLTDPSALPGRRNTSVDRARLREWVVEGYRDAWHLLLEPTTEGPVLLPAELRDLATSDRVGLPPDHPWRRALPGW